MKWVTHEVAKEQTLVEKRRVGMHLSSVSHEIEEPICKVKGGRR